MRANGRVIRRLGAQGRNRGERFVRVYDVRFVRTSPGIKLSHYDRVYPVRKE